MRTSSNNVIGKTRCTVVVLLRNELIAPKKKNKMEIVCPISEPEKVHPAALRPVAKEIKLKSAESCTERVRSA